MKSCKYLLLTIVLLVGMVACKPTSPGQEPDPGQQEKPVVLDNVTVVSEMPRSAKRGVSFNLVSLADADLLAEHISWFYNWGPDVQQTEGSTYAEICGVEFCPMTWTGNFDANRIRNYVKNHPSCQYLLAFNEPNLTDQCNMVPKEAAKYWPSVKAIAQELNLKIVSPAMNYGTLAGYSNPVKWLDEFFACDGVSLEDVSAIAIHCYMGNPGAVRDFVDKFTKYGKPIWVTEFCGWESNIGSADAQLRYMCDVINSFEQNEWVERYAWFMPRTGAKTDAYPYMQLLTKTSPIELTTLGKVFNALSSMNKEVAVKVTKPLQPNMYSDMGQTDTYIYPTTDSEGEFMIASFMNGQWIEYQIYAEKEVSELQIRYASPINSTAQVLLDGTDTGMITFEKTGSKTTWAAVSLPLQIEKGAHTLRLSMNKGGNINMGQLYFK